MNEEEIAVRLEQIQAKLASIPMGDPGRYYVYYKEDVRFLLELLEKSK